MVNVQALSVNWQKIFFFAHSANEQTKKREEEEFMNETVVWVREKMIRVGLLLNTFFCQCITKCMYSNERTPISYSKSSHSLRRTCSYIHWMHFLLKIKLISDLWKMKIVQFFTRYAHDGLSVECEVICRWQQHKLAWHALESKKKGRDNAKCGLNNSQYVAPSHKWHAALNCVLTPSLRYSYSTLIDLCRFMHNFIATLSFFA